MDVLGTVHKVTVIPDSPYDPENARLRARAPGTAGQELVAGCKAQVG
jgi:hypothetical protein